VNYLLMIPGPVEIRKDILDSYYEKPVAHYGHEWAQFYIETTKRMSRVLGSEGRSFLVPGSGSLGLEIASATFCRSKRCLVLQSGFFGERLYHIVSKYSGDVDVLNFPKNVSIDVELVNQSLGNKKYDVILMVHVETSTGVINHVEEIAKMAKEHGALSLIDAISSAGIERLEMDNWSIDVVITASQKGLECPPGLAVVTIQTELLNKLYDSPSQSWYTDLRTWCDFYEKWHDWHPFPVTLPTNTIMALSKSLNIIESEGVLLRQKMYEEVSGRFRKALLELGLDLYVPNGHHAHGLTSVSTNGKFSPSDLVMFLKNKQKIQIAGSLGEPGESIFRIAHMSRKQCENANLISVINGIALFMKGLGLQVSVEKAVHELQNE